MELCPYCGDWASVDVSEIYFDTRELVLDACCEENRQGWIESIRQFSRRERARWMLDQTGLVVNDILVTDETLQWTLDYGLELQPVSFSVAKEFIRAHHRHCEPPTGWKYGASLYNGDELVGVVTAGRPVSRVLAAKQCIEINRVCVKDLYPHALVKNACSMLYGYACREAFERGYTRVVTYTRRHESGSSLRAAGFVPVANSRGGSWSRRGRIRPGRASTGPKIRWERWKNKQLPLQHRLAFASDTSLKMAA
jgi:hypothetical protein